MGECKSETWSEPAQERLVQDSNQGDKETDIDQETDQNHGQAAEKCSTSNQRIHTETFPHADQNKKSSARFKETQD